MQSKSVCLGTIDVPLFDGKISMVSFDVTTLDGLAEEFKELVKNMLSTLKISGIAYFTIHGRKLCKNETLRRPGAHVDGNYEPFHGSWRTGGWKVGEDGPPVGSETHYRQYVSPLGGMILATNYSSAIGWNGDYDGIPNIGGNCSHIELDKPFVLESNKIYYGNNHFIHESLPVDKDVHRVMVRITLPETHEYQH